MVRLLLARLPVSRGRRPAQRPAPALLPVPALGARCRAAATPSCARLARTRACTNNRRGVRRAACGVRRACGTFPPPAQPPPSEPRQPQPAITVAAAVALATTDAAFGIARSGHRLAARSTTWRYSDLSTNNATRNCDLPTSLLVRLPCAKRALLGRGAGGGGTQPRGGSCLTAPVDSRRVA